MNRSLFYFLHFLTPSKAEQPLPGINLQEKEKDQAPWKVNKKEPTDKTCLLTQSETFSRQKIPQNSCARKETVDLGIPIKSRDGDKKIMENLLQ